VKTLSATGTARRFSDLLDVVERDGGTFVVVRRGRAVARIEPTRVANGGRAKELLRATPTDRRWATELHDLRESLAVEERRWTA